MRTKFHQFFKPTNGEIGAFLNNALISYDTNVLLNLYRFSVETRSVLVEILKTFADRTHLPHQVALEYARNRVSTIIDQALLCQQTEDEFKKVKDAFIIPKNKQPFLSSKSEAALDNVLNELATLRKQLESWISSDPYADILINLFDAKIGDAPDTAALQKLHEQASERFKTKTPPGYADSKNKPDPQSYGDYIVWRQLMDVAVQEKKDIIFVTDENKEDWILKHRGRTIGFRPELLEEFRRETGKRIWLLNSEGFLVATRNAGSAQVADSVIQEIANYHVAQTMSLTSEDKVSHAAKSEEDMNGSDLDLKETSGIADKKTAPEDEDDGEQE